jgi:hypothetical protein
VRQNCICMRSTEQVVNETLHGLLDACGELLLCAAARLCVPLLTA